MNGTGPTEVGTYAGVGAVLAPSNVGPFEQICTGVLVDRAHVLTAAHCVVLNPHKHLEFALPPGKGTPFHAFEVVSARVHPAFRVRDTLAGMHDIAILTLADGPVDRSTVVLAKEAPRPGETITVVGTAAIGATNHGNLVGAVNTTVERVSSVEFTVPSAPNPQPCNGDSGGPAFVQQNGLALVGIASRAAVETDDSCRQGAIYTRVDVHKAWLEAAISGGTRLTAGGSRRAMSWWVAGAFLIVVAALWFVRRRASTRARYSHGHPRR